MAFADSAFAAMVILLSIGLAGAIPVPESGTTPPWPKVKDPLEYFLLEELRSDLLIGNAAVDARLSDTFDAITLGQLSYSFVPGVDERQYLFDIDPETAIIKTTEKIDRDALCPGSQACLVLLHVQVHPESLGKVIRILVEILDINDHQPLFPHPEMELSILESAPVGTEFILPPATDIDSGANSIQRYELLGHTDKFELQVTEQEDTPVELKLILKEPLDRETKAFYKLTVVAHDGGKEPKSGSITVNINVEDVNDNDPTFTNATYEAFIDETNTAGSIVYQVRALDRDLGENSKLKYGFTAETEEENGDLFGIFETSGQIYLKDASDFEYGSTYLLVVTARDQGGPESQPGHATVIVRVKDPNDNPPKITLSTLTNSGIAQVSEGSRPGDLVAQISVADQDEGDNGKIECSLSHPKFALEQIHQSKYRIVTTRVLDREIKPFYDLTVVCRDLGSTPNVATQEVRVQVVDINDESPQFDQRSYNTHIRQLNRANDLLIQVHATDRDDGENGQVVYALQNDARHLFHIDADSGRITATTVFTRESPRQLTFHVTAQDLGDPPRSTTASVTVTILDENDDIPLFTQRTYEFGIFENKPVGSEVGSVRLSGQQQMSGHYQFYFPAANTEDAQFFRIDSSSGKIYTKITLDRERQSVYYMQVQADTKGSPAESGSVSVTIYVADQNDNPPIISFPTARNQTIQISGSLPKGYELITIKASDKDIGGNGKLTYFIVSGNQEETFAIHPATGLISIAKDLAQVQQKNFRLRILVQDNGYPQLHADTNLDIFINTTLRYNAVTSKEEIMSGEHSTVVISVTAASLVFVFVLLFLILVFLLYRRQHASGKNSTDANSNENHNYSSVASKTLTSSLEAGEKGNRPTNDRATVGGEETESFHHIRAQQSQHPVTLKVDNNTLSDLETTQLRHSRYTRPSPNHAVKNVTKPDVIDIPGKRKAHNLCEGGYSGLHQQQSQPEIQQPPPHEDMNHGGYPVDSPSSTEHTKLISNGGYPLVSTAV